jgi:hypothetical protein
MILEHISKSLDHFSPTNIEQYTALQIARKLSDLSRLRNYLIAAERHPLSALIATYRKIRSKGGSGDFFLHLKNN